MSVEKEKAPSGCLSQHITFRIENKGTCKRSRHKCKAVKLPPNQHKMFFSLVEESRDRGSTEVRGEPAGGSWPQDVEESEQEGGHGAIVQLGVGGRDLCKQSA